MTLLAMIPPMRETPVHQPNPTPLTVVGISSVVYWKIMENAAVIRNFVIIPRVTRRTNKSDYDKMMWNKCYYIFVNITNIFRFTIITVFQDIRYQVKSMI